MTRNRLKSDGSSYYHCISRVVGREYIFKDDDKDQFVHWMHAYAEAFDVQVLTYCIMSNHVHIILEIPERPKIWPTEEEFLKRHLMLHGEETNEKLRLEMTTWTGEKRRQWLHSMQQHLCDVSRYMKVVKQRFTQWYNRENQRRGTLWEERFKSVLIEGTQVALAKVGAYIELNPVRANLVDDPKDYPWCGYAAAFAGKKVAVDGLMALIHPGQVNRGSIKEALAIYRSWLFGNGIAADSAKSKAPTHPPDVDSEKVRGLLAEHGQLTWSEFVRCRVRYFTDGGVMGSKEWVNEVFNRHRTQFSPKRKDGARKLRFVDQNDLFALRDLRVNAIQKNDPE